MFNIKKLLGQLFVTDEHARENLLSHTNLEKLLLIVEQTKRLPDLDRLIQVDSSLKLRAWSDYLGV